MSLSNQALHIAMAKYMRKDAGKWSPQTLKGNPCSQVLMRVHIPHVDHDSKHTLAEVHVLYAKLASWQ